MGTLGRAPLPPPQGALQAPIAPATGERPRNLREARKALKAAAPLIRFLKTKRVVGWGGSPELIFGNLGERVEHAVQNYVNAPPPITARGRPGNSWLAGCIFVLAGHLMYGDVPEDRSGGGTRQRSRRRLSEKGTIRAIERLLKRAGHGEVVTKEKIRHVMRRERPVMRRPPTGCYRTEKIREDQGRRIQEANSTQSLQGKAALSGMRDDPDFTQELPRKLLPTRAKGRQTRSREKR